MLAMKNERHEVEASLPGLASFAKVTLEQAEKAIAEFEAPDPYSRNPQNDGRKIVRCASGWKILNGDYYAHLLSADERKEYQKQYQREYRKRRKHMSDQGGKDGAMDALKDNFKEAGYPFKSDQKAK